MAKFIDLTGQKFGKLTVIKRAKSRRQKCGRLIIYWECKCDCGNISIVLGQSLKNKNTKSCGCLLKQKSRERALKTKRFYKHGLYKNEEYVRIMHIFSGIKMRCYNLKNPRYKYYGARGIKMCDEWFDKENGLINFYKWAINNGYKNDLTIDRIDVNGNYEPKNCRWVTMKKQCNNRRNNRYIEYNDETHTLIEWCRILNINYRLAYQRLYILKWNVEKVFNYS